METYVNVDKNMVVNATIGDAEVVWCDVRNSPFSLHGFYEPKNTPFFQRMPVDVAESISEGVGYLSRESAGGRVRFSTNSPYIAIRAKFLVVGRSSHMPLASMAGFDMYIDGEFGSRYVKDFPVPQDIKDTYEQIIHLDEEVMRSYTINFPVHSVVEKLEIGIKPGALLDAAAPYRDIKPVVFYGSSIVHGSVASRPGCIYPAVISRQLNVDFLNMGFSGKAKGEPSFAKWLATLPMSIFVCDYDFNTRSIEHLTETHYPFYEIIREKNPDLPYVMITRPDYWTRTPPVQEYALQRRDVIMTSYLKARATGDKNVYFIDGMSFNIIPHYQDMSCDGLHPNDSGFLRMADSIGTVLRHILEKRKK